MACPPERLRAEGAPLRLTQRRSPKTTRSRKPSRRTHRQRSTNVAAPWTAGPSARYDPPLWGAARNSKGSARRPPGHLGQRELARLQGAQTRLGHTPPVRRAARSEVVSCLPQRSPWLTPSSPWVTPAQVVTRRLWELELAVGSVGLRLSAYEPRPQEVA